MGASGGIPDIAVRLSAQGVADVVAAFQRVRQEGKQTGVETAAGLELINGALESLAELLPAISLAVAIEQVVELGLSARETAEDLGKLSEKTGANIGTLSALALVAHDSEIGMDQLNSGLVKLAKNQQLASDGSKEQLQAFAALGISLKDLRTQDPGQLFVTVAQRLAAIPSGALKAQTAIALFGKTGAELIPMLNALGENGFDEAVDKAKKLGLYLSEDMVESARAAQDALHQLEDVANGIGNQFVAGFAPKFTQGIQTLAESVEGDGVNAFKKLGEWIGNVFNRLLTGATIGSEAIRLLAQTTTEAVENSYGRIKAALSGYASGGVGGAVAGIKVFNDEQGDAYWKRQTKSFDDFVDRVNKTSSSFTFGTGSKASPKDDGSAAADAAARVRQSDEQKRQEQKTAQARSAYYQSLADNELSILKLKNQLEEAEDKRSYDAGLITLDQYYNNREARIKTDSDAEIAALQEKQKAIQAEPTATPDQQYKQQQDLAKVQTQITEVQMKEQGDLAAVESDRAKAKHDAALKELEDTQKLQQASGDRYGAEETQLQIELQQYTELLQKQGKSVDEINAAVAAYKTRAQASIDFNRAQESGSTSVNKLNLGIGAIQDQAANGSISNVTAQAQILQLQRENLDNLKQIGQQMTVNAKLSGDPKEVEAAEQYNASLQHIEASLKNVTTAQTYLVNQLTNQGVGALTDFFTAGISGSKSFSDALSDLASSFEQIVAGMISKLLVYYALMQLVGWVAPDSDFAKDLSSAGPFGSLTGHDSGGWTGDGPVNQVTGFVHGQEFVIKAGPATKYRDFLEAMNAGQTPDIASTHSMATTSGYVDDVSNSGGNVTVNAGSAAPIINVVNNSGQQVKQSQRTGPGGQSITDIVIGIVNQDISAGGQTAQTIQKTFGTTRQGVRRG